MSENKRGQGGEFRGDFTRDTFDPAKNFTRVLMQQGRVQLDADWNEQVSILHHYMRQLGEDLMGPHAAPVDEDEEWKGFKIDAKGKDFSIAIGSCYVRGIPCYNGKKELSYLTQDPQPHPFVKLESTSEKEQYLVYLDVWERNLSFIEDDSIREKALGGADTAMRSMIVWQVRAIQLSDLKLFKKDGITEIKWVDVVDGKTLPYSSFLKALEDAQKTKPGTGKLRARAKQVSDEDKDPCLTAPEASYRGAENQLYRIEIHNEGSVTGGTALVPKYATFKWSRENGSVIFPIIDYQDGGDENIILELEHLGRDDRFSLEVTDWVEVVNKNVALQNQANPLLQVTQVDREKKQVFLRLSNEQQQTINGLLLKPSYLRRWDQKDDNAGKDGVLFTESNQASSWISLENGIEIQFTPPENGTSNPHHIYQTGDYWLIPARTATGDVEWPVDENNSPKALSPHGVEHYYAPLAKITVKADGTIGSTNDDVVDLRRKLKTYFDLKV